MEPNEHCTLHEHSCNEKLDHVCEAAASGQDLGQNSLKSLAGLARWSGLADGDLVRLDG